MKTNNIYLIFLFIFSPIVPNFSMLKRPKQNEMSFCGEFDVRLMKPVHFHSNITIEPKTALISDQPIGRGQIGEVFIGYYDGEFGEQIDAQNFSPKNCVAIKKVQNFSTQIFSDGIKIWEKLQREVPKEKRRHIVALIDHGKISWNIYLAIMEMGEAQTFYDCLKNGFYGKNMEELIREMIEPLKEMHQVGIHLDYKPSNLVYVIDQTTQQKLLKVIDLDNAVPVPSLNTRYGRANVFERPPTNAMITQTYVCPEFIKADLVSTKADMWSFGISLYELLLNQPKFENATDNLDLLLNSIADLHRGFCVSKFGQFSNFILDELLDQTRFVEAIQNVIQIWTDFPKIALLITVFFWLPKSLLDIDFVVRMTAIGVLDYLDGKCCPQSVQTDQIYPNQLKVFNKITFEQIHLQIAKVLRQNQTKIEAIALEKINTLLEEFFEKPTDWIDELRARETICDTTSTNF